MNSGTAFSLVVDEYAKFRPTYPIAMFEKIITELPFDRRNIAMDLGAGTGLSTLPLCQWFNQVIAVEPDIKLASKLENIDKRIIVRVCKAEECLQSPSSVDLVISVNAFYWMDGPRVVEKISLWLRPNGVLAVCRYGFPKSQHRIIRAILDKELQIHWNKFRHPRLIDEGYSQRCIMAANKLSDKSIIVIPNSLFLNSKQLVGFFKSTSYVSAYLRSIRRPERYLSRLESQIREASGQGSIPMDFDIEIVLARKTRS
jgi:SAM-dependent methyltransferase